MVIKYRWNHLLLFAPTGRTSAGPVAQSTQSTHHIPRTIQTHVDVCLRAGPGQGSSDQKRVEQSKGAAWAADGGCRRLDSEMSINVNSTGRERSQNPALIRTPLTFTLPQPSPAQFSPAQPSPAHDRIEEKQRHQKGHICLNHCVRCCCQVPEL